MLAQIVIRTEYNKPSSSKTWHVLTFNFCISVMRRKGTEQLTRSAMVKRNHYAIFIWNSLLGITRRNGVPKGQEQLGRKGQNPLRNVCNARKEEKEEKNWSSFCFQQFPHRNVWCLMLHHQAAAVSTSNPVPFACFRNKLIGLCSGLHPSSRLTVPCRKS